MTRIAFESHFVKWASIDTCTSSLTSTKTGIRQNLSEKSSPEDMTLRCIFECMLVSLSLHVFFHVPVCGGVFICYVRNCSSAWRHDVYYWFIRANSSADKQRGAEAYAWHTKDTCWERQRCVDRDQERERQTETYAWHTKRHMLKETDGDRDVLMDIERDRERQTDRQIWEIGNFPLVG